MPLYRVRCSECGSEQDLYRTFKTIDELPLCCGKPVERKPCAPMVMTDIAPYKSMVTGEMITSRSHHKEHLKRHSLIEIGNETKYLKPKPLTPPPGLKEDLIRVANEKLRSK